MNDQENLNFYKEYPKTCNPEDFWGQVKRTVDGKPIPQEQVDMIVEAVSRGVDLRSGDRLLDLCCGNGALTTLFFSRCEGGLGVDNSEYLINVARKHFLNPPNHDFLLEDVGDFARNCIAPERFTKALCYGSLQYLPKKKVGELLTSLRSRFQNIHRLFIGNLPDKNCMDDFFGDNYQSGIENSPGSSIGIWWTAEEFRMLAENTGWCMELRRMPKNYFAAYYRFDAILSPKERSAVVR